MRFEFATSARVIFGAGTLNEIGPLAASFGRRALVVTGRDAKRAGQVLERLSQAGVATTVVTIAHEPTTDDIIHAVVRAREAACDLVIGFGGGASLDAAKAVSALLTNTGDLLDYLEVVGR